MVKNYILCKSGQKQGKPHEEVTLNSGSGTPTGRRVVTTWKRASLTLLMMLCLLAGKNVVAQSSANYTFMTNTDGSLALDMNSNAIDMSTGTTQLVSSSNDQGTSSLTNIGFDMYFMNNRFTQFGVSANGIMQLGGAVISTTYVASGGSLTVPRFAAFGGDSQTGSAGKVHYKIVGTAPNRTLVIEYLNMNLYYVSNVYTNDATYQIRLYESTGIVEYVYGGVAISSIASSGDSTPSIGFSAGTTSNLSYAYVTTATHSSLTGTTFTDNPTSVVGVHPDLNTTVLTARRVYRYTPPGNATNTLATTLAAPTNLTFSSVTGAATTLNWTASSPTTGVLKYAIYNSTDGGTTYNYVATTNLGTNTYAAPGLTPGTTYNWRVYAISEGGKSTNLSGTQATNPAATYYWVGPATGGDWTSSANWNTAANTTGDARTIPSTTDILIIDGPAATTGNVTINVGTSSTSAAISIGALRITNGTTATLTGNGLAKTITLSGATGDDLDIASGSGLSITNTTASNGVAIAFASASSGLTGNIAGTLAIGGNAANSFVTTGGTGTVVTVTSTGVVNFGGGNTGTLTGSAATFKFASGATYNHMFTSGGTVPTAEWNANSNITLSALTGSGTVPSGLTQSFGNFTYGSSAYTGAASLALTTSTTIQGNFNVTTTGTGSVRLLTSGTLNIGGNLNISGGTVQGNSSSTGTVNVAGNLNISSGMYTAVSGSANGNLNVTGNIALSGGTFEIVTSTSGIATVKIGGNFIQTGGTVAMTAAGSGIFEFNGTGAQQNVTITGAPANPITFRINNSNGVNLTGAVNISSLIVIKGNLTGSGSVTFPSTGSSILSYSGTTAQTATAVEWPATGGPNNVTLNNTATAPNNTVTIPFSRSLPATGVLTLTAGIFKNDGYTLTLNNTSLSGAISGATSAKFITGALERTLPASYATAGTYVFPVGKGTSYNPFELVNPVTTSGGTVTVKAEAKTGGTGGSVGTGMSSLNTNRYWEASITAGAANFTDALIKVTDTDTDAIVSASALAASSTLTGTYSIVGGGSPTVAAGTTVTTTAPKATTLPGYFAIGNKAVPMAYVSSTSTQAVVTEIIRPATNQQIIGIQVVATGNLNPLSVTLKLTTEGSTNGITDISKAKVFYTGTSSVFATTAQFGSDVIAPSGEFTVTGSQTLAEGTNYFWVTYDLSATGVNNNFVDAQALGVIISGTTNVPTVTSPAGNRKVKAPLSGDYNVGAGGAYTSISAAITDLNAYGVEGPVRFLLANGTFSGTASASTSGVAETYPSLTVIAGASATNTIKFLPASGATVTVTGSSTLAIFNLNGASYVTIDGSNNGTATKNLTIVNTSTGATGTIRFVNGASYNTVKNTIIQGVATSTATGVVLFAAGSATSGNNYNTITANDITKGASSPRICVGGLGTSGVPNTGNIISSNRIMDFSTYGIQDGNSSTGFSDNTLIEGNEIFQNGTQTSSLTGIYLASTTSITNMVISKNKIYNLTTTFASTTVSTVTGIDLYDAISVKVVNNTIALNNNTGTVRGIAQETDAGSTIEIYYNTVSITGSISANNMSFAYLKNYLSTGDIVKNNIFSNTRTSTSTGKQYAINYTAEGVTAGSVIDYNDYYSNGNALNVLGVYGTTEAINLAGWQTATSQDVHSVNIPAAFTSATDLHLVPATNAALDNLGAAISGVSTDFDNGTRSATTPDMGADEFTAPGCSTADGGTATAAATICNTGTTVISATGYTQGASITYQWQTSATSNGTFTDVGTASAIYNNYTTPTLTATTYYRLKVVCTSGSVTGYSAVATATVNAPAISGTTPGSRCGTGTVALAAAGSPGTSLSWYAAQTGGTALGTGVNFTTPQISATTSYYVESALPGSNIATGPANYLFGTAGSLSAVGYQIFTATEPTTISEVTMYATAAGLVNITLSNSSGTVLQSYSYTVTAAEANSTATTLGTPIVVPVNFAVPAGTGLRLGTGTGTTASLIRNSTGSASYYNVATNGVTFTSNSFPGTAYWYFFYNIKIQPLCKSGRVEVIATVNTPPAFAINGSSAGTQAICAGGNTGALTSNAAAQGYTSFQVTSIPANAAWSVDGDYKFTFTPAANTVYTVTATQGAGNLCSTTATYSVTVNALPAALTITPSATSACSGEIVTLAATGGSSSTTVLTENFNGTASTWTTTNNSTGGNSPSAAAWTLRANSYQAYDFLTWTEYGEYEYTTFNSNDNSKFYLSNSDMQGYDVNDVNGTTATLLTSPQFSLAGYTSASLTFYQYYEYASNSSATVEINTGSGWTTVQQYTTNQGTATGFVLATVNLTPYAGNGNVKIRFNYQASWGYYWAVDNVTVTGGIAYPVTWASTAPIYTDSTAQTAYVAGTNIPTVYVKPTAETTYTATVTNASGCTASTPVTITIGNKYWTGTANTSWSNPANWCGNILPTSADDVIIPGVATAANQPSVNGGAIAYAKSLVVQNGATVTVKANATLDVQNYIYTSVNATTPGNIIVRDSAAIRQYTNIANEGNAIVHKYSNPLYKLDYTLWGSPVAAQQLQAFSPATISNRFYTYAYNYVTGGTSPGYKDAYFTENAANTFTPGKGYLIRMPDVIGGANAAGYAAGTYNVAHHGTFTGTPNNGNINVPILFNDINPAVANGTLNQSGHYIAVSNPYPSPISVTDFFSQNAGVLEAGNGMYFWRKKNNGTESSYAHLTMLGFAANSALGGDMSGPGGAFYYGTQAAGTTTFNANWIISPGQGFLVKLKPNLANSATVSFTNTMRRNAPASGGQPFFRTMNNNDAPAVSRLWLNITNDSNAFGQALIGYMDGATLDLDYGYDGRLLNNESSARLYSKAAESSLAIQARPAFTATDVVPMGFAVTAAGQYTINLDHVDGVFSTGQVVYLKDNLLGTFTNLSQNTYTFTTDAGTFDSRFEVVYMPQGQLGTETPALENMVVLYQQNGAIHINSGTAEMTDVTIYDIRGRKLYQKDGINATQTAITGLHIAQEVIIVEINTNKGRVSKKIIY